MRRLQPSCFFPGLDVRPMTAADIPAIAALFASNPRYLRCCGAEASEADIASDLEALPPGKHAEEKYYVGFYDGAELCAVLDLIDGYPDEKNGLHRLFHGGRRTLRPRPRKQDHRIFVRISARRGLFGSASGL